MRKLPFALLALALLPLAASAQDDRACKHSAPRNLSFEVGDARTVVFQIGQHDVRVSGAPGKGGRLQGRACASGTGLLDDLTLTQERVGDRLIVRAQRKDRTVFSLGNYYAYLKLEGTVPDDVAIEFDVGSGDAVVSGVSSLALDVGSGDAEARQVKGAVSAKVGSGDIALADIGSLDVSSVGSGDLQARKVRGSAKVGSIGSGDLELHDVAGSVDIGSIGSGDAELARIGGGVEVGSIGSGDIDIDGVRGDLVVRSKGSGSVDHANVTGKVDLPKKR